MRVRSKTTLARVRSAARLLGGALLGGAALLGASCAGFQPRERPDASARLAAEVGPARRTAPRVVDIPMHFEANHGQTDARAKYLSRGPGYTVYLTADASVFALRQTAVDPAPDPSGDPGASTRPARRAVQTSVLRMHLVGANPAAELSGLEELPGKVNYFIGDDPAKWRTNVPLYGKVEVKDVYRGIDVVYYGNPKQLEHDFVVAPGASPDQIRLAFEGQTAPLRLDPDGNLVVPLANGHVVQQKPIVYQEQHGSRQTLTGRYVLYEGAGTVQEVGFAVAAYDPTRPLVIDPALLYASYLGGSDHDFAVGVAVDSSGSAYVTGYTESADFPVEGAYDTIRDGSSDAFVTKVNADATAIIYSTYLGGAGDDEAHGLVVDSAGNAYVTGATGSTDFPTTVGAFQTSYGGGTLDLYVTKLAPAGDAIVYSTYLGGTGMEFGDSAFAQFEGGEIAVDVGGNAYVTGGTQSTDFPTLGAYQGSFQGGSDVIVTKLNPTGTALVYSTYLGGSGADRPGAIAIDSTGNAYVVGTTQSADFPTTGGALQTILGGGLLGDAFVTKLSATGSSAVYSTYLGGSDNDRGNGIAVDAAGNAYVVGNTESANFPTVSPLQSSRSGPGDGFITKLQPAGNAADYSTYLGGSDSDGANAIVLDSAGNAYVTGQTCSANFPLVDAFQATRGGSCDAYISKLNATGSTLLESTYLGGNAIDFGIGIALAGDSIYVSGYTVSTSDLATSGVFQTSLASTSPDADAFLAKLGPSIPVLSNDGRTCQKAIAKAGGKMMAVEQKALAKCLIAALAEVAKKGTTTNSAGTCATTLDPASSTSAIGSAIAKYTAAITSKCGSVSLAEIGPPCDPNAANIAAVAACVVDAARASAQRAIASEFRAGCTLLTVMGLQNNFPRVCNP